MPETGWPPISEDLQRALGDIECGAEERMEVLRGQKHALEMGDEGGDEAGARTYQKN